MFQNVRHALAGGCGNEERVIELRGNGMEPRAILGDIRLVEGEHLRSCCQFGIVQLEFPVEHLAAVRGRFIGQIDDKQQHFGPFDVAQKFVPESFAGGGAFNEARDIGDV